VSASKGSAAELAVERLEVIPQMAATPTGFSVTMNGGWNQLRVASKRM
jgi:hypothetical protein